MSPMMRSALPAAAGLMMLAGCASTPLPPSPKDMTFFVTSVGPGKGADLGGLAGADQHCQTLAKAAGAGDRTWRAYLSTQAPALNDPQFVNARDRIGTGPWQNAKGVVIARSVDELHSANNNLVKATTLDEKGQLVNGRTETPNKHDMLTGSRPDGTAFPGTGDLTCGNWTSSSKGRAQVGHHDGMGPDPRERSWNSAHASRGCSPQDLTATGGSGLFYCFALD
jgi:hypothetical protein